MGSKFSKLSLEMFEFANEAFVAVGAGITGIVVLLYNGNLSDLVLTGSILAIACFAFLLTFKCREQIVPNKHKVIFITGCDTGLGFSMALHANEIGFQVVAGCLNPNSEGASLLTELNSEIRIVQMDITNGSDAENAVKIVEEILDEQPEREFWALINNAGIMTFAEFEWQTENLMRNQIMTNLYGTCLVTKAFCPLLRKYQARLITVTSHCAHATLPGLSVYGATKTALGGWMSALRLELKKYGVKVIAFVPGSFTTQSHIMSNHVDQAYEMQSSFTQEQKEFYGDYFSRYNAYLNCIPPPEGVRKIKDPNLYTVFENLLTDKEPKFEYVNEKLRYYIYHRIFRYAPLFIRDFAIQQFMTMPKHEPSICAPENIAL